MKQTKEMNQKIHVTYLSIIGLTYLNRCNQKFDRNFWMMNDWPDVRSSLSLKTTLEGPVVAMILLSWDSEKCDSYALI